MTVPLVPRVRGLRRASWPRRARGNLHGLDVVARGTGRHVLSDGGWRRNGSRPVIPPQDESKQMRELVSRCLLSLIHISEPTRLGMISYAVFCLKKEKL